MNLQKKMVVTTVLLWSLVVTSAAHAIGATGTNADYGVAVTSNAADRTIELTPAKKWINVANGETVRFNIGDKAFSWHFSTFNDKPFDLSAIAPAGVDVKGVRVYVAMDTATSGP
ncbi:MAG TPA: CzcE family metal-binding protein [Burkholderiaceae bacterium]|jgi:hypothetical protein